MNSKVEDEMTHPHARRVDLLSSLRFSARLSISSSGLLDASHNLRMNRSGLPLSAHTKHFHLPLAMLTLNLPSRAQNGHSPVACSEFSFQLKSTPWKMNGRRCFGVAS